MTNNTLLYRQVHPTQIKAGMVSPMAFVQSNTFEPKSNEERKLSVYNGEKFTAVQAWTHFTEESGRDSAGVLGVTVQECNDQSLSAGEDNEGFEGHAHIDFTSLESKGAVKRAATLLRDIACRRNWLHKAG